MAIKVLVFESDPTFAETLRQGLLRYGCEVSVVDDANTGLQAAGRDRPDLILLAIELPRMNGFSVCNKLKRDPALKDVPLIIMSSESTEETFEQHRRLRTRAEDYVHKPISFDELVTRIQTYVPLSQGASAPPSAGSEAPPMSEGAIVLDDDIEIEDAEIVETTEDDAEVSNSSRDGKVDADVDDFAEQAFGALIDEAEIVRASAPPEAAAIPAREEDAEPNAIQDDADEIVMDDAEISLSESSPASGYPEGLADDAIEIDAEEELEVGDGDVMAEPALAGDPAESLPLPSISGTAASAGTPLPAKPPAMRPSSLPPRAADLGDVGKYREELEKSRGRAKELEDELRRAKDRADELEDASKRGSVKDIEVQRMQRELDEVKAKLASSGKGAGSAREFLDLREQLNKKDKEILDFKDQLSHKEKELLGLRDTAIGLEREKADSSDKIAELEKLIFDLGRTNEAFKSDREQAVKRADDFKRKAEKTKLDLDARSAELTEVAATHQAAIAEREEREATLIADQQQTLQEAAREKQQALVAAEAVAQVKAEAARQEARANARAEHEQAVAALSQETERRIADAVLAREAELQRELEGKLTALHRAHEDALGKLRAEHQQSLVEAAAEAAKQLAEREAEIIADNEREQAKEAADHSSSLLALVDQKQASEAGRDARIAALEADLTQRTNERDSNALTLEQRDTRLAQLEADLAERTSQRDHQNQNIAERDTKIAELEAALASANGDVAATKGRLESSSGQLARASAKWSDDRASLERAKDALAAALAQIEEAEGRPFE